MKKSLHLLIILLIGLTLLLGFTASKERGKFVYQMNNRKFAQESFTIKSLTDNRMVVSSTFQMLVKEDITEYIPSGSYTQTFNLNEDFGLLSYVYEVDTKEGKLHVEVDMQDKKAAVTSVFTADGGGENTITKEAEVGDQFILTQVSAVQLMIVQRTIHKNSNANYSANSFKLFGLSPTDPFKPSLKEIEVWGSKPTFIPMGSGVITARRYRLKINDIYQEKDLTLRTYSDEGRLLGLKFFADSRILIYRADLFPNGFL